MQLQTSHGQAAEVQLPLDDTTRLKGFAFASSLTTTLLGYSPLTAQDGQAVQGRALVEGISAVQV